DRHRGGHQSLQGFEGDPQGRGRAPAEVPQADQRPEDVAGALRHRVGRDALAPAARSDEAVQALHVASGLQQGQ
ncbi:unnamed protein product, partial [Symbiodinium necroappetens]